MATRTCDGCGRRVRIAGGVANLWSFDHGPSEGLALELADGSEWFLCFDCIDRLPEDRDVTAADVETLGEE